MLFPRLVHTVLSLLRWLGHELKLGRVYWDEGVRPYIVHFVLFLTQQPQTTLLTISSSVTSIFSYRRSPLYLL